MAVAFYDGVAASYVAVDERTAGHPSTGAPRTGHYPSPAPLVTRATRPRPVRVTASTVRVLGWRTRGRGGARRPVSNEARFAAQLSHPNIVAVHDFIEYESLAYLVMEFVEGPTIANLLKRGPMEDDRGGRRGRP